MSSDEVPIDTGIVHLGHEGKQKMPISKIYINLTPGSAWEQEWIPPPLLLTRGFKVLYHLNLNKTPLSLIVTYRCMYTRVCVCICVFLYIYIMSYV